MDLVDDLARGLLILALAAFALAAVAAAAGLGTPHEAHPCHVIAARDPAFSDPAGGSEAFETAP